MKVELASYTDNESLLKFFNDQIYVSGPPADLTIRRKGSYFDKYKLTSDDFDTFVMKDTEGNIRGTATIVYRETLIQGKPTTIGYGMDLHISHDRQSILMWPELFYPQFIESLAKRNCKYTFSVINFSQSEALNALIRPSKQRPHMPRYYLLRKFDLVSIHGRSPFLKGNPLNTVKIFPGSMTDLEPLVEYLKKKSEPLLLSYTYTLEFMLDRFKRWKNFSIENFLIAKDVHGNIVGCCAPWSNSHIQSLDVEEYSDVGESFRKFSKIFSYLKLSRELPPAGHSLNFKYLTHLHVDNSDIFRRMLKHAFKNSPESEFLSYINFSRDNLKTPPSVFITSSLPFALYTVLPPETTLPPFLQPTPTSAAPDLEIALF